MKIFSRVLVKHQRRCDALAAVKRGDWETPWSGLCKDHIFRDSACRKNGGHYLFQVIGCNMIGCPARLAIRMDDVLAGVAP